MQLIQPPSPLPARAATRTVFLAGSIDLGKTANWQADLAAALADCPGTLLNPRRPQWDASWRTEADSPPFREQVEWELAGMESASLIAFYFAPQSQAPVTLLELGLAARGGKAIVCCPAGFWRKGNVDIVCARYRVPMVGSIEELSLAIRAHCAGPGTAAGTGG